MVLSSKSLSFDCGKAFRNTSEKMDGEGKGNA